MEVVVPILGIGFFLYQRFSSVQEEERKKLLRFKKSRLIQRCVFQYNSPPFIFNGVGQEIAPSAVPTLSKDQVLSFLINGYLVLKVNSFVSLASLAFLQLRLHCRLNFIDMFTKKQNRSYGPTRKERILGTTSSH
jgi:hypothetical protein